MRTELLINNQLQPGEGSAEAILDAARGNVIATVREAQCRAARRGGRKCRAGIRGLVTNAAERPLRSTAEAGRPDRGRGQTLAQLESSNTGKPLNAVINDEIPTIADVFRYFAGAARAQHGLAAGEYAAGFTSMIRRDPVGVVGSIAPWNYPLMMAAWKLAPAIAAGNTVVLKPSEQTPLTALHLAPILAEIFPPGVVNIVCGRGETVGAPLTAHPRVRLVSLTGDVATGQKVLAAAAGNLKRTHLELGGKAPVIVFDDADLQSVVAGVRTFGYYNAGQDCTAACRIYAGSRIYDRLVADLTAAVSSIRVGLQTDSDVEMGPLISAGHRESVAGFVQRAADKKHIEITTGGRLRSGSGFFYEPTVIAGALQSDEIVRREVLNGWGSFGDSYPVRRRDRP